MNKYAWDVYSPHFVGLDDIFHRLDSMTSHNTNYPPYNLIKHDNSKFTIEKNCSPSLPSLNESKSTSNRSGKGFFRMGIFQDRDFPGW